MTYCTGSSSLITGVGRAGGQQSADKEGLGFWPLLPMGAGWALCSPSEDLLRGPQLTCLLSPATGKLTWRELR